MKVKDLIKLLENLNPEAELSIRTAFGCIKLDCNDIEEQIYSSYYRGFVSAQKIENEIAFREKEVTQCTARKNSKEYKDTVSQLEWIKNSEKIPTYILTYKKSN